MPYHSPVLRPLHKQGILFVLSAPSGTGKDTVIRALQQLGMNFYLATSVTTRTQRIGESDGNPYHFVNQEEFERLVTTKQLLEYTKVHGNWYGLPLKPIRDNLLAGRDVLLKIDVQGAATVRRKVPQAIFIFLVPESLEELTRRLNERNTETKAEQEQRLTDARQELAEQDQYDYIVVNRQGQLQEAVDNLCAIIRAEHCRTRRHYIELQ